MSTYKTSVTTRYHLTFMFFEYKKLIRSLNDENKLQVDEKKTKTEKFKKSLKMYNIINFQAIRYKMTASGNINPCILNYEQLRPVSILRLPKNLKNRQKPLIQKKLGEERVKAIKK